jgi:HEAT repeat protein
MADIDALIAALDDRGRQREAIKALGAMGDPRAIDPLARLLRTEEQGNALAYRLRQLAAQALGEIGDATAVTPLRHALADSHSAVKVAAARALGMVGSTNALPDLVETLDDESPDVRSAVLRTLGNIHAQQPIDLHPVSAMLADMDDSVRQTAQTVLAGAGESAFEVLAEALTHHNSTVRGAAADLLGQLGLEASREPLNQVLLSDDSRWVRSRAEAALQQLPGGPNTHQDDDLNIARPQDTIAKIRRQRADWSHLTNRGQPQTPTPTDPDAMTDDQIRALLDQLDVRLVNGEISEATYQRLYDRWSARLSSS